MKSVHDMTPDEIQEALSSGCRRYFAKTFRPSRVFPGRLVWSDHEDFDLSSLVNALRALEAKGEVVSKGIVQVYEGDVSVEDLEWPLSEERDDG